MWHFTAESFFTTFTVITFSYFFCEKLSLELCGAARKSPVTTETKQAGYRLVPGVFARGVYTDQTTRTLL